MEQERGESREVALESVARTFSVDVVVLERAVALGIVGRRGAPPVVYVEEFDRVAAIVRMHVVLGVDLETVAALL